MLTTFVVYPIGKKVRYYKDLNGIKIDFSEKEIEGATIQVLINSVVAGTLETETIINELYNAF